MTPFDPTDEQLAAWLAGDLDAADGAAVEARVEADAAVAARADALADVAVALSGADDVEPPDGYEARLRARLVAESEGSRVAAAGTGAGAATAGAAGRGAGARPGGGRPEDGRPAGRAGGGRQRRLQQVLSGLALVALLGVGSLVVVRGGGFGGGDTASQDAGDAAILAGGDTAQATRGMAEARLEDDDLPAATEAAAAGEATGEAAQEATATDMQDAAAEATDDAAAAPAAEPTAETAEAPFAAGTTTAAAAGDGPALLDSAAELADPEALRARYADRTDLVILSETSAGDREARAAEFAEAVRAAPAFTSGPSPAACLDQVLGGPRLVTLVETVVYAGRPGLAYLVLEGDLARVTVSDPTSCQELAAVDL